MAYVNTDFKGQHHMNEKNLENQQNKKLYKIRSAIAKWPNKENVKVVLPYSSTCQSTIIMRTPLYEEKKSL